jgi:hypothetical protein
MPHRRAAAVFFLLLLALGVVWPAVAGVVRCGDCCHTSRPRTCDVPATGFSLCCFHSASTLPPVPRPAVAMAARPFVPPADQKGGPPPDPRGVLHVPKALLA